jgi:hypothetical protein
VAWDGEEALAALRRLCDAAIARAAVFAECFQGDSLLEAGCRGYAADENSLKLIAQVEQLKEVLTDSIVGFRCPLFSPCGECNVCIARAAFAETEPKKQLFEAHAVLRRTKEVVKWQAEDGGLWFSAQTAPEAYLQNALRTLHAAIEGEDVSKWLGEEK